MILIILTIDMENTTPPDPPGPTDIGNGDPIGGLE